MTAPVSVRAQAAQWLAQDPDPQTRAELSELLHRGDERALEERFAAKLEFGTAGLRGPLGAGPGRMNRVTVMRAAAGLAARLKADTPPAPHPAPPQTGTTPPAPHPAPPQTGTTPPGRHSPPSVVIGYDARHKSDVFASDTAAVLTGAGVAAYLMPRPLPTPVLAFAVRYLRMDAGVMVTASHNPPRDNGYKVYWHDGALIVPPLDSEIAAAMDAIGRIDALPLGSDWQVLDDDVVDAYSRSLSHLPLGDARDVTVAYTPLHGVGHEVLRRAFERTGFPVPLVVAEQADPDPDFPTVAFPNPEEPGAMDLALTLGASAGADLVIANDPDADRCAVAVGGRMLTGDEVGGLLAEHVLRHTSGDDRLVVTTIVSSSLLSKIAKAHGVRYAQTLTGFKWIMHVTPPHARDLQRDPQALAPATPGGPARLVFAYEEALGYCVGGDEAVMPEAHDDQHLPVRDKDGISAALAIAGLAAEAKRDRRTLLDLLDDQARRYGLHATAQLSVRAGDLSLISDAMARLRKAPPGGLGGHPVSVAEDLASGAGGLPPADGLRLWLTDGTRVVIRPSGTEPKLKCYLETVVPVAESVKVARAHAAARLEALRADLATELDL